MLMEMGDKIYEVKSKAGKRTGPPHVFMNFGQEKTLIAYNFSYTKPTKFQLLY
jgi:hypothetical protein